MAKFKVGDKAKFIGRLVAGAHQSDIGVEVEILTVGQMICSTHTLQFHGGHVLYPGELIYGIKWPEPDMVGYVGESGLEKPLSKHQDADLKAAEPLFIQSQLPRWLNDPVDYTKEKKRERENQKA